MLRRILAPVDGATDVGTWEDVASATRILAGESTPEEATAMTPATPLPPEALDDWLVALCERLALDPAQIPVGLLLDVARDVAHGVARPAAPLSTFLVGLAAGRAGGSPEDIAVAASAATELAGGWSA